MTRFSNFQLCLMAYYTEERKEHFLQIKTMMKHYLTKEVHLEKMLILKDTCTPVFTAAPSTIGKTWKHLNVHQQMNG